MKKNHPVGAQARACIEAKNACPKRNTDQKAKRSRRADAQKNWGLKCYWMSVGKKNARGPASLIIREGPTETCLRLIRLEESGGEMLQSRCARCGIDETWHSLDESF